MALALAADVAPVVSDKLQATYWKENAALHAIDADMEKALKTEAVDRRLLDQQAAKVNTAGEALRAACGEKYELDQAAFQKGEITCVAKPKPPAPAAAKP